MKKKRWILLAGMGGSGLLLQVLGAARFFAEGTAEVNLAAGTGLFLLGTCLSMWAVEFCAAAKGRSGAWALLALLGPVGPAAAVVLKDRGGSPREDDWEKRSKSGRSRNASAMGVLATLLISAGFLWAGAKWAGIVRVPSPESEYREMLANEAKTFGWLGEIARAQERYRERDWDGDGKPDLLGCVEWSVYPFFAHAALEMERHPEYDVGPLQ